MNVNPRDMQVHEILTALCNKKSDEEKVNFLRTKFNDHQPLRYIVKMAFCATIVSCIPLGEPPFHKQESDGPSKSSLWQYLKMFPMFVETPKSLAIPILKRESMFIEMLESLEPKEAEMVCLAKDKNLESKWDVPADIFMRAFPDLQIYKKVKNAKTG